MQRLRRLLSRDRPPPPEPEAVRASLVEKLRARGCIVLEGAAADRAVADAHAAATQALAAEPAETAGRCHVPQLNIYSLETSASAPDIDGTVQVMTSSWRHGKEIMMPEVRPSPSREHLVVSYRCVLTPKGDDAALRSSA